MSRGVSRRSSRVSGRERRGEWEMREWFCDGYFEHLADLSLPNSSVISSLVILAGDISPIDILSHIPVLCEESDVPYIFVSSKEALGAASSTKRPTSTVMIVPDGGKNKKTKVEVKEDYAEDFSSLAKEVKKLNERIVLGTA